MDQKEEEEEEAAEKLHYVEGRLPCGLWIFWAGRFSKNVLVEPHEAVSPPGRTVTRARG